ncbi:Uncharacterized protein dnm_007780 [Desulfonema magnum]|uniref:Uncharacterized protein n=1 Tax=Desulfonema magnum TaxID=45655 RepID=A0A975GLF8_9BACT|nr:Uncharacterized protein dnm_007780 [Desulfonema magnum]
MKNISQTSEARQVSSFKFQVSSFKFQVSSFKFRVSSFKFQVSSFKFQVSSFKFQVSSFKFQVSQRRKIMNTDDKLLQRLGRQTVLDENENSVSLSSLWKEQKTVLVFVRHFG